MTTAQPAQPQTTGQTGTGPFIEFSEPGKGRIYDLTSQAYGALITQPLVALPGWLRNFRLKFVSSGGTGGSAVATADAPYNVVQMIQVWDALGTPIYALPGYEALCLIPLFSGGFGTEECVDPMNLPSYSAPSANGNFSFASCVPFEFAKGVGVIGAANGDALPKVQIQLNPQLTVFSTPPATLQPTVEVRLNSDYYWLPTGENVSPPGLGSTRQWFLQQGYPAIPCAYGATPGVATITIPRQGGYLDTIILIARNSLNVREDVWPTIFRFKIDGIGTVEAYIDEIYDDMAIAWGIGATTGPAATKTIMVPRPAGVIAITRKTSLGQRVFGLLDTYEAALSTSSGTSMTIEGAPWSASASSSATGPGTLSAILGQVIPSGALTRGLVEA
jgi:hypothetical protein